MGRTNHTSGLWPYALTFESHAEPLNPSEYVESYIGLITLVDIRWSYCVSSYFSAIVPSVSSFTSGVPVRHSIRQPSARNEVYLSVPGFDPRPECVPKISRQTHYPTKSPLK